MRKPRDYQQRMLYKLEEFISSEQSSLLIASPPGSGKGDLIAQTMVTAMGRGLRCLFLVHKKELMRDIADRLVTGYGVPGKHVGFVYGRKWQAERDCVFTTQQTAYRRIHKLDLSQFNLVFIDEAHRTGSATYRALLDELSGKLVGLTGTPWREDNVVLENFFQTTEWMTDMDTLLDRGFIVPTRPYAPVTASLSGVRSRRGDFVQSDLERAFLPFDDRVLTEYQRLGEDRKTIVFCHSVQQAQRLTRLFEAAGYATDCIYHGMAGREEVLARFERDEIQVLFNIAIFTEGYDNPATSCVIWATATQSRLKYVQATMRGIRSFEGKSDCIVIDLGGNTVRHGCVEDYTETVRPAVKECPECSFVLKATANRCPSCNTQFMEIEQPGPSSPRDRTAPDHEHVAELALVERRSEEQRIIRRYTLQGRKWKANEDLVVVAADLNWPAHEVFRKIAEAGRGSERLVTLFVHGTNKTKWIRYYMKALQRLSARGLHYELEYRGGQYFFVRSSLETE